MIAVTGPTNNGRFNLFGTEDGTFILQGTLSLEQLDELVAAVVAAKAKAAKTKKPR